MTELTAWLIASLYEGAFLVELTALENLDQAKEVASRRTIKKVRWNIAPKSVEKDRNFGGLDYLP
jgi:cell division septation protein DedD